jgi:hypothetical protein
MDRLGTADELADYMRELGYRAQLTSDSDGDPLIKSAADGINFLVFFYGSPKKNFSAQFSAGFTMQDPRVPITTINEWNRTKRWGKALLDREQDPVIKLDFAILDGVTKSQFEYYLGMWVGVLSSYVEHIGWRS